MKEDKIPPSKRIQKGKGTKKKARPVSKTKLKPLKKQIQIETPSSNGLKQIHSKLHKVYASAQNSLKNTRQENFLDEAEIYTQTPFNALQNSSIDCDFSVAKKQKVKKEEVIELNINDIQNEPSQNPTPLMDTLDYEKRFQFEKVNQTRIEQICLWKARDYKGIQKSGYVKHMQTKNKNILSIASKTSLERNEIYMDRFPFLELRKSMMKYMILIHLAVNQIISTKVFDNCTILVILANTLVMTIDDSAVNDNPNPFFAIAEKVFLYLYTSEMIMKIVGMGFIFGKDAYLRDSWNILDFIIVVTSWPTEFQTEETIVTDVHNQEDLEMTPSFSFQSLRTFRVLRPLKTISSIKGLKVLMVAVLSAIPLLTDTLIILGFFFIAFAIGGLQIMSGELKKRCISIQTGIVHPDDVLCGGIECPGGYFCGKNNENPNYGVTNFDNLFYAILSVFQCVTLEGWSDIQVMMQRALSYYMFSFFIPLVFIGAFFLLNLTLAVINAKFTEAHKFQQHGTETPRVDSRKMYDSGYSIQQYINAKIYAKKMIKFLRNRQKFKLEQQQLREQVKEDIGNNMKRHFIKTTIQLGIKKKMKKILGSPRISSRGSPKSQQSEQIKQDKVQLAHDINELLQNGISDLQAQGKNVDFSPFGEEILSLNHRSMSMADLKSPKLNLNSPVRVSKLESNNFLQNMAVDLDIKNVIQSKDSIQPDDTQDQLNPIVNSPKKIINFTGAPILTSNLITSDSEVEMEAQEIKSKLKNKVTETFKRVLSANPRPRNHLRKVLEPQTEEGTNHEIESKFTFSKKSFIKKKFAEDKVKENDYKNIKSYLESLGPNFDEIKAKKETVPTGQAGTVKQQQPFSYVNPITQKVDISKGVEYQGTSQAEVFKERIENEIKQKPLKLNQYLTTNEIINKDEFIEKVHEKNYEPFQKKVWYKVEEDSSMQSATSQDTDEAHCAEDQPFDTHTRIRYENLIKQAQTNDIAKRSDVILTSTLAVNVFPVDKREISQIRFAKMSKNDITKYVDQKNAFRALKKEISYQNKFFRQKDLGIREHYFRSFFEQADFKSNTLSTFKQQVKLFNSNKEIVQKKTQEQIQIEKTRFKQNQIASKRRGLLKFDYETAINLIEGNFHEEKDNDEDEICHEHKPHDHDQFLDTIEKRQHIDDHHKDIRKEIPPDLKQELSLPHDLKDYQINFDQIKINDSLKKKENKLWSGQDVLRDRIDTQKSVLIVADLNCVRIWPKGLHGIYKKVRTKLRIIVKSRTFDNLMNLFVLLNTITLSMNSYGMKEDLLVLLETFNVYFTWIFISEMIIKIASIGVNKYSRDKMNLLDGSIAFFSLFEIITEKFTKNVSSGDITTFRLVRTTRMVRSFRVLRISRLLRSMQSIQTIFGVISRSYKSFVYITALMFLFIFIYSLLGMNTFGGRFNFQDGIPRGNYDNFSIAFITVFQVLTMENWQLVLFQSMRSQSSPFIVSIFYISWIFIGNFILLNLFLAILLDSFLEEDDEDLDEEKVLKMKAIKKQKSLLKRHRKHKDKLFMKENQNIKGKKIEISHLYFGEAKGESEEDLEDLDEDQIMKIFKQEGIIQKEKDEIDQKKLFAGIECQQSFYIFSQQNWLRIKCYKLYQHSKWETGVIIFVILSSIKLATDTYMYKFDSDSLVIKISEQLDIAFNVIFIIEMTVKLIACGFCMDKGSYLRDSWNQLDFFIVTSSLFDMILSSLEIKVIKILRMLRTLRPLRFISHNVAMKMIVIALFESVGHIFNVLIVVAIVYLIFAIVGITFFSGKFFYCSIDMYELSTAKACEYAGGKWMRFDHNFDNVGNAFTTLYVVASLEGWPDIMYQVLDMVDIDTGPKLENNTVGMIYFVVFILIGSFFFLNFFIGVLFMKFNQAQRNEQKGFSLQDLSWQDIQRLILSANPEYETTNVPKQKWRQKFHALVSSQQFDIFIMSFIILNMVQMGSTYDGQSKNVSKGLEATNVIFTIVFTSESILKIIGYGKSYFENSWNKFDFFVVVMSLFDYIIGKINFSASGLLANGPQIARLMRVLRVTRLARLAGKAEGLQAILQTIQFSIPSLANVLFLLILIFFMFSIMGNFLFKNVVQADVIDEYKNFRNFSNSFLLLIALTTGEDWNKVMFDCSRQPKDGCIPNYSCGSRAAIPFFYILILICSYIMLNLFVLVIIQQFEKYYLPDVNTITLFKQDLKTFMEIWKELTQDKYRCLKIKESQLTTFFRKLGSNGNLGFSQDEYDDQEIKKQLLKMGIKSDNGFVYFNELLYRCMRRKYGNMKIKKKMQIFELRTQYKIYLKTQDIQNLNQKKDKDYLYNQLVKKGKGVNPFLTIMNYKISFKAWLKQCRICEQPEDETEKKTYMVDIEVDDLFEVTSDEEIAPIKIESLDKLSQRSNRQSKRDKSSSFNRKLTKRIKSQTLLQKQISQSSKIFNSQFSKSSRSPGLSPSHSFTRKQI